MEDKAVKANNPKVKKSVIVRARKEELKSAPKVIKAEGLFIRMSTRKAREVADLVRGKYVEEALRILKFTPRKPAGHIAKVIRSAVANAEENSNIRDMSNVKIGELRIEMGPPLKRFMPRAYGRASQIRKPTTHIKVVLVNAAEVK